MTTTAKLLSSSEFWHTFWFGFSAGVVAAAAVIALIGWAWTWLDDKRQQHVYDEMRSYEKFREGMSR